MRDRTRAAKVWVRGPKVSLARHYRGCRVNGKPTCGGAYECDRCGRLIGWCNGGHEGSLRDGWCDQCWAKDEARYGT